jgi:DNA-binding transcriptional ArsR family regulator
MASGYRCCRASVLGWSMIQIVLGHTDLARIRFASSPIAELVASLRVLDDPARRGMYGPWLSAVNGRLGGVNVRLVATLAGAGGRLLPDFLLPPPAGSRGVLADELETVAATPPSRVRSELAAAYRDRPLPVVLRALYEDPAAHLPTVVAELRNYWQVAIDPVWPRLRALCQADLSYRGDQLASGGIERAVQALHPEVSLAGDRLVIDKPGVCEHRADLDGTGVVLVPCAFAWPVLIVSCCGVERPVLTYPPRGVAELWARSLSGPADPVAVLLGRTRARLLAALSLPMTTTQLAGLLGVSPPTASHHLKTLEAVGLVNAHRRGRVVFYKRTEAATALLAAVRQGRHETLDD